MTEWNDRSKIGCTLSARDVPKLNCLSNKDLMLYVRADIGSPRPHSVRVTWAGQGCFPGLARKTPVRMRTGVESYVDGAEVAGLLAVAVAASPLLRSAFALAL